MRVSFHPAALDEVDRAQAWYEERNLLAAAGFFQELTRAIQRATIAPERHPSAGHGTRRILFDRFPFTLIYLVRSDEVFIIALAHQKRRPGYWSDRTRSV
jgi:toxin ParE1/3/4